MCTVSVCLTFLGLYLDDRQVTMERDELQEENSALEAQIVKLKSEIETRLQSLPQDNNGERLQQVEDHIIVPVINNNTTQAAPVLAPIFVMSLHDNALVQSVPDTAEAVPKLPPKVSRPHARYPSPSDSWPSHILSEQPKDAGRTPC